MLEATATQFSKHTRTHIRNEGVNRHVAVLMVDINRTMLNYVKTLVGGCPCLANHAEALHLKYRLAVILEIVGA